MEERARDSPELLYHYTSQSGLIGILQGRELWASQIHYLNDSKEFWHSFQVARDELNRRVHQGRDAREKEKLETLIDILDTIVHVGVCVTSFSEQGDSLGQWRAYCGGGAGFAIGFSAAELEALGDQAGFSLHPCIYDADAQATRVGQLIDAVMATDFNTCPMFIDPQEPNEIVIYERGGDFLERLTELAPLLKHHSFVEELEWRLISRGLPARRLSHCPGTSMITPYFPLSLVQDGVMSCVRRIVIGPTPHPRLSEMSVHSLLEASGLKRFQVEVRNSAVPFRNW